MARLCQKTRIKEADCFLRWTMSLRPANMHLLRHDTSMLGQILVLLPGWLLWLRVLCICRGFSFFYVPVKQRIGIPTVPRDCFLRFFYLNSLMTASANFWILPFLTKIPFFTISGCDPMLKAMTFFPQAWASAAGKLKPSHKDAVT